MESPKKGLLSHWKMFPSLPTVHLSPKPSSELKFLSFVMPDMEKYKNKLPF